MRGRLELLLFFSFCSGFSDNMDLNGEGRMLSFTGTDWDSGKRWVPLDYIYSANQICYLVQ